ncbi:MAG: MBL fold metallo-hydrolase [Deltaproteobacteria bacterium]|nr:MBL fold metallo-hydrolase [Deltaproteobacteria bacterium]
MLQIDFLGSGSSGNATVIRYEQTCILYDCGFSGRELKRRLENTAIGLDDITAVLLTHEHRDHIGGLPLLARRESLPVYLTEPTNVAVRFGSRATCQRIFIQAGQTFRIEQIEILPFEIAHDARQPVGYVLSFPDGTRLGIATDLGHANPEALEALDGCNLIGLEANHDPDLLKNGPYPWFLKQRIRSNKGHLSNPAAADLLSEVAGDGLQHIFGLHLSETNNRPALAKKALVDQVSKLGLTTQVSVISQNEPLSYAAPGQMALL